MSTIEISCVEVWREISNFLDDQISAEMRKRMEAHFKQCAHCKAVLDGTRNVVGLVGEVFRNFMLRAAESALAGMGLRHHGYPCTSTISTSLFYFSARCPHSDPCDELLARHP